MASYARSWEEFERAGLHVAAVVVDSVEQNRAMVGKLLLPFPILSDPESRVIREWGVLNEKEANIARPALFLVRPDRSLAIGYVGVDYSDRPTDEELFAGVAALSESGGKG